MMSRCPVHENIIPMPDTPTTSRSLPNPSVASLPEGTVVRQSTIQHAGLGVSTTKEFQWGSTFRTVSWCQVESRCTKRKFRHQLHTSGRQRAERTC
eukprot:UN08322